jgi:hypothetical protein
LLYAVSASLSSTSHRYRRYSPDGVGHSMSSPRQASQGRLVTNNKAQRRAQRQKCSLANPVRLLVQSLPVVYKDMRAILSSLRTAGARNTTAVMDSTLRSFAGPRRWPCAGSGPTVREPGTESSTTRDVRFSPSIELPYHCNHPLDSTGQARRSSSTTSLRLTKARSCSEKCALAAHRASKRGHTSPRLRLSRCTDIGRPAWKPHPKPNT